MMKVQLVYLTLCSLSQSAYINRMTAVNRLRAPTPFRPGVIMQRPWMHQRLVQAASHRPPYVLYRNSPHRYAIKHYGPSATRNIYTGGQWKTSARLPQLNPVTPEYEFIRAASAQPVVHTDGDAGAIHTIPAPNLSLSEKPIVVIDGTAESNAHASAASEQPTYEVTEKYPDVPLYQMAKIETPVSFPKMNHMASSELQALVRNGAALQYASEYGLPAISLPHNPVVPQQFTVQAINNLPTREDVFNPAAEGIVIPPNALYQPDPMFLQKLQSQLLQRYPSVEFIPYAADVPQIQIQSQPQTTQTQQLFLLENEQITKQSPAAFIPHEAKNIVQRATQESSPVTLIPQNVIENITETVEVTSPPQPNITYQVVAAETQPITTTIKYFLDGNTEQDNTTPIYYAQIGQSVGNVIANGFYSAINDVRAAAALEQVDSPQETTQAQVTIAEPNKDNFTTTLHPDLQGYFMQNPEKNEKNQTANELKSLLGVPFAKKDSVNVAYTLQRVDEKDPKMSQEGAVYAGQIVEATISEDQEFNNEKATFLSRRPPIRLFAVSENKDLTVAASSALPKMAVVKAKIPPKSKLTFDVKTGEPVLRIYASYADNPKQREIITARLANLQHSKEDVTRKDSIDNWKSATVKSVDKTQGFDANQVTQFGLKLKSRSDDYLPLFEEYDDE